MSNPDPDSKPAIGLPRRILNSLTIFARAEMGAMAALGFSSGLPIAIKGQALQARMAEAGMRPSEIGLFSFAGLPYVLKFLWAPFLDALPAPWPFRHLGRRRGWLVCIQLALMAAVICLGLVDPRANPWGLAALAVLVAFTSASQDIVIDALRIERIPADSQSAALSVYVASYRIALLVAAAGTLAAVAGLEHWGLGRDLSWQLGYMGLAALVGVGLIGTWMIGPEDPANPASADRPRSGLRQTLIEPLRTIASQPNALMVLTFVLLFKLGDAMADTMTLPFALNIGFDKATYAWAASGIGLIATLSGGFAAGLVERTIGPWPTLWIGAIVQAVANLSLAWLALIGPEAWALVVANSINNLGHGFGAVVFVAFLSRLCTDKGITATHYALLSALAAMGRTVMVGPSGYLAEALGWPLFFVATFLACIPGIGLLYLLDRERRLREGLGSRG